MLFNSFGYALFFPIVYILYWILGSKKPSIQNVFLLIVSYFFYACWDWRFLFLLIFSTGLDFFTGIKMAESKNKSLKNKWFWLSVLINIGFLGVFKYYNFFITSFSAAILTLGFKVNPYTLQIILPIGISFYTFHGLSYVIDIYYDRIKAEYNFVDYAVFVSFFPLLVAGPIERSTHLLPQIKQRRIFNYAKSVDGIRQILWGLFKKIVIADNCAEFADIIFKSNAHLSGSTHLLGAFFFTFQIYCDFSGYSDIALGSARLLGIDLLRNFAFPYFSRDIAEFWRRWHISLSSWFRDYLYIPLGGSKVGLVKKIRNTFIIFIVSGFWHGANWTFIFWGFLNALCIIPSIINSTNRVHVEIVAKGRKFPNFSEFLSMVGTFILTIFLWIFFRAENLNDAFYFIGKIFSTSFFSIPYFIGISKSIPIVFFILFLLIIEWIGREQQYGIEKFGCSWKQPLRWSFYIFLVYMIVLFQAKQQTFIYFQF